MNSSGTFRRRGSRFPWLVSMGCAILPFLGVHIAYLLAAAYGQVPWCFPYLDSCTSISATGRAPPAAFVFRGVMLPSAMLIAVFWWLHARWLSDTGCEPKTARWMLGLGLLACLGLVLYVTVLGEVGDWWRLQRRIGTILFFSFTFLAQLLLARRLCDMSECTAVGKSMLRVCVMMLVIGVLSVVIQFISEAWHDAIEDAIEWLLALMLQLNFLLAARLWWGGSWRLEFTRGVDQAR